MEKYREALKKIHEIATFTPRVDPLNPSMLGIVDLNQAIEEIWEIAAEILAEEVANNPERDPETCQNPEDLLMFP